MDVPSLQLSQILPALADAAVKSTVVLAFAVLLLLVLRKTSAATRHLIWCGALVGAMLLPALSWMLPAWQVPGLRDWRPKVTTPAAEVAQKIPAKVAQPIFYNDASVNTDTTNEIAPEPPRTAEPQNFSTTSSPRITTQPKSQPRDWRAVILRSLGFFWLAGALITLLPLLAGWWQVARLTRRCAPEAEADWNALLKNSAAEVGLRRPVRLLIGARVGLPMTWGAWRPVLLLPETARGWTIQRRRVVLLHELAHVQRWDWLTQTIAYFACALYWYNPLAWLAARRMRLEREQACDDLVLQRDTRPSDYADELLQLAAGFEGRRLIDWATVPMARKSALEGRLRAILDGKRNRASLTRVAIAAALAAAAIVIIPMAMVRGQPAETATVATPKAAVDSPPSATKDTPVAATAGQLEFYARSPDGMVKLGQKASNITFPGIAPDSNGPTPDPAATFLPSAPTVSPNLAPFEGVSPPGELHFAGAKTMTLVAAVQATSAPITPATTPPTATIDKFAEAAALLQKLNEEAPHGLVNLGGIPPKTFEEIVPQMLSDEADMDRLLAALVAQDPKGTVQWVQNLPEDIYRGYKDRFMRPVLLGWAKTDPASAASYAALTYAPGPSLTQWTALQIVAPWALKDFAAASAWANGLPEGDVRQKMISMLLLQSTTTPRPDPAGYIEYGGTSSAQQSPTTAPSPKPPNTNGAFNDVGSAPAAPATAAATAKFGNNITVTADKIMNESGQITAIGKAVVKFGNITVTADKIANVSGQISADGNVVLKIGNSTVTADQIVNESDQIAASGNVVLTTAGGEIVHTDKITLKVSADGSKIESVQITLNGNVVVRTVGDDAAPAAAAKTVPVKLSSLDLKAWSPNPAQREQTFAWGNAWGNGERLNTIINIGGQEFADGVTMGPGGVLYLKLDGQSDKFTASIGLDNGTPDPGTSGNGTPPGLVFCVLGDGKVLYKSAPLQHGDAPVKISVDTRGVQSLGLGVFTVGNYTSRNRDANWADATFEVSGAQPQTVAAPANSPVTLEELESGKPAAVAKTALVKLTSLDLTAWGPNPAHMDQTFAWGNEGRHNPDLNIGGRIFKDGVTMRAGGVLSLRLDGGSDKFTASIGIDNISQDIGMSDDGLPLEVIYRVFGDGKVIYESTPIKQGEAPVKISVDTEGVKILGLGVFTVGNYKSGNRDANWADATFEVSGAKPQTVVLSAVANAFMSPPAKIYFTAPVEKFSAGDKLEWRLKAMGADLHGALDSLKRVDGGSGGAFVEKSIANVIQGIDDTAMGETYLSAHPEINPVTAWSADNTAGGAMPKPLPPIPSWVGINIGRGRAAGGPQLVNSGQADQNLVDALNALRKAYMEFSSFAPEINPYEVGDIGGKRDLIRQDIAQAVSNIVAALDFVHNPIKRPASPDGELVVNGDFEAVPALTNLRNGSALRLTVMENADVPDFGWRVVNGSTFQRGSVTLIHEGMVSTSGATTFTFGGSAYDGHQWLDLAGGSAGCLSQIIPTEPGKTYALNFAYANSPFPPNLGAGPGNFGDLHPVAMTVTLKDTASEADLITPLSVNHNTSTLTDYHWDHSGPISFTAKGAYTTLQFTPNYKSNGFDGMFLDGVSVKAVSRVAVESAPLGSERGTQPQTVATPEIPAVTADAIGGGQTDVHTDPVGWPLTNTVTGTPLDIATPTPNPPFTFPPYISAISYETIKQIAGNMTVQNDSALHPSNGADWDVYYLRYPAPPPLPVHSPADKARNERPVDIEIRVRDFPTLAAAQSGLQMFRALIQQPPNIVQKPYGDVVYGSSKVPFWVIFRRNNVLVMVQVQTDESLLDHTAEALDAAILKSLTNLSTTQPQTVAALEIPQVKAGLIDWASLTSGPAKNTTAHNQAILPTNKAAPNPGHYDNIHFATITPDRQTVSLAEIMSFRQSTAPSTSAQPKHPETLTPMGFYRLDQLNQVNRGAGLEITRLTGYAYISAVSGVQADIGTVHVNAAGQVVSNEPLFTATNIPVLDALDSVARLKETQSGTFEARLLMLPTGPPLGGSPRVVLWLKSNETGADYITTIQPDVFPQKIIDGWLYPANDFLNTLYPQRKAALQAAKPTP